MTTLRNVIITISLVVLNALSLSAAPSALVEQADSAYMHDNFNDALSLYLQAAESEGTSASLYYNIGNCYYRLGQPGRAIVYYERSLRLDPSDSDARANLEFVNSRITDEPGDRGMFITKTVNAIANRIGANTWAWIAITTFILTLVCIALYMLTTTIVIRKTGFFGAFVMLLLCIIANIMASVATDYSTTDTEAIVTVPASMLSTSPRAPKDRSEEAMLLHEGTKVEILDSVSTRTDTTAVKWYDVRIDNEHRAWIRASDIERI